MRCRFITWLQEQEEQGKSIGENSAGETNKPNEKATKPPEERQNRERSKTGDQNSRKAEANTEASDKPKKKATKTRGTKGIEK